MSSNELEDEEDGNWEKLIRRMLPAGAPLPDEDHADYSIAVEYQGPPLSFEVPKVHRVDIDLMPTGSPSIVASSDLDPSIPVVLPVTMKAPRFNHLRTGSSAQTLAGPIINDMEFIDQTDRKNQGPQNCHNSKKTSEEQAGSGNHLSCSSPNLLDQNHIRGATDFDNEGMESSSPQSTVADAVGSETLSSFEEKRQCRRGTCSRCERGNRFTDREACLVCGVLFCSDCILKAMGSMPEGRKCVGCIGKQIDETKRSVLGKQSRILSKVCSPLEVKQIMKAEMDCSSNQLRPEQLVVNGRQLRNDELSEIFGCPLPPQKLRPGKYWYDKDSGLWGKEGEKPDQIISSKLNVGGKLKLDASSGNTKVYINGREITKRELRVLKLAKVQCPRDTHFWVYDDGSYEEEGQNNIKGNIWGKVSTRFISSLFSLPTPSNGRGKKEQKIYSGRTVPEYLDRGKIHKLLLLGLESSGTSTVFKQAKFLYGNKFTQQEIQCIKHSIQSNLYKHLGILLEGRERFEEEALENNKYLISGSDVSTSEGCEVERCVYSINQRFKHFSDWLLNIMANGDLHAFFPAATREYAPVVDELWKDPAIQETYKRRGELRFLLDDAKYFLDRVIEISSNDYEPSEKDILYAEGMGQSNGVTSSDFSFDDRSPMSELYNESAEPLLPLTRYKLIRIGSRGVRDGCKWLEMFEDVRVVIFCVALSDYDQMWGDGSGSGSGWNKMEASRELFESVVRNPSFEEAPFVLLLNKYDVFEEKIGRVGLSECGWFGDFSPVRAHQSNQAMAQQAYFYVAMKFKELYGSVRSRKLFVWQANARDRPSVDEAFKYVREVLKWNEDKDDNLYGLSAVVDDSFYSMDASVSPFIRPL